MGKKKRPQPLPPTQTLPEDPVPKSLTDRIIVLVFCEAFGMSLCIAAGDAAVNGRWLRAVAGFAVGLPFVVLGFAWSFLKKSSFALSVRSVAVNFQWWIALALVLLVYLGMPEVIRPFGYTAEKGDPSKNKYVCQHVMAPIGAGKYALLIEFGVRQGITNGFHTQITLQHPWADYRVWYGAPHKTNPPALGGGVNMEQIRSLNLPADPDSGCVHLPMGMRICTHFSNQFDFSSFFPSLNQRLSYYVYFADDATSPTPDKITFSEDVFAMENPEILRRTEVEFGRCPD